MSFLAAASACLSGLGLLHQGAGTALLHRHPRTSSLTTLPPVSILKPLHGTEPLLEAALETFFLLEYPAFQLVFGVGRSSDPALTIVETLRHRYPLVNVALVIDGTLHGPNRKIGNLINMLPAAKHEILLISDADMHVPRNFLQAVTSALQRPEAGLATTFYTGLAASGALAARLGAAQINHGFLPAAALARAIGRQDCLGATMALRRSSLEAIGGLRALVDHLADDNVLGQLVRRTGRRIEVAQVVPATTIPEESLKALWRHELRWARTIRALVPAAYPGVVLQFPLFWAMIALPLAGFAPWFWISFGFALMVRTALARALENCLGLATDAGLMTGLWLLPLRDAFSAAIFVSSFWSDTVEWRGHMLRADSGAPITTRQMKTAKNAHE